MLFPQVGDKFKLKKDIEYYEVQPDDVLEVVHIVDHSIDDIPFAVVYLRSPIKDLHLQLGSDLLHTTFDSYVAPQPKKMFLVQLKQWNDQLSKGGF